MSYTPHDLDFETGLAKFRTAGPVQTEQQYLGRRQWHKPVKGSWFVRLDMLRPLDANDLRLSAVPAVDTSYIQITNPEGSFTHIGVDGAYLECPNFTIPAGQGLHFFYNFIANDQRNKNDFAVIEFYDAAAGGEALSLRTLIHDTRMLGQAGRAQTGWLPAGPFQFAGGFRGTVRWVVSNGRAVNMAALVGQARPSCLLLDCIQVLP